MGIVTDAVVQERVLAHSAVDPLQESDPWNTPQARAAQQQQQQQQQQPHLQLQSPTPGVSGIFSATPSPDATRNDENSFGSWEMYGGSVTMGVPSNPVVASLPRVPPGFPPAAAAAAAATTMSPIPTAAPPYMPQLPMQTRPPMPSDAPAPPALPFLTGGFLQQGQIQHRGTPRAIPTSPTEFFNIGTPRPVMPAAPPTITQPSVFSSAARPSLTEMIRLNLLGSSPPPQLQQQQQRQPPTVPSLSGLPSLPRQSGLVNSTGMSTIDAMNQLQLRQREERQTRHQQQANETGRMTPRECSEH